MTQGPSLFWLPLLTVGVAAGCAPFEDVPITRCAAVFESGNGTEVGINQTFPGDEVAQSFTPSFNETVSAIDIPLRRVGTLTGVGINLRLVNDSGGNPATANLATAAFAVSDVTLSTSFQVVTFTLDTPVALLTTQTYWIRLEGDYGQSSTNYVAWRSNSGGGYAGGKAAYETAVDDTFVSTLLPSHDLLFRMGCEES